MERMGRGESLSKILRNLANRLGASACLIVDNRGLLISDYSRKKSLNIKAMGIMSSLLDGTGNKFINAMEISRLKHLILETSNGIFLLKEIPMSKQKQQFILCVFLENSKNNSREIGLLNFFRRYLAQVVDLFSISNSGAHYNDRSIQHINKSIYKIRNLFSS
ncbi:MAG: roadblock/LC7 domain-containing protein [Promethearchaeota archaeon]